MISEPSAGEGELMTLRELPRVLRARSGVLTLPAAAGHDVARVHVGFARTRP